MSAKTTESEPNIEDLQADRAWMERAASRYEKLLQAIDAELQKATDLRRALEQETLQTHATATRIEHLNEEKRRDGQAAILP